MHDKSKTIQPTVTKFSTRDELEAHWSGIDFGCERSKVKVTRLENVLSACLGLDSPHSIDIH